MIFIIQKINNFNKNKKKEIEEHNADRRQLAKHALEPSISL